MRKKGMKYVDAEIGSTRIDWLLVSSENCRDQKTEQELIGVHFRKPHEPWGASRRMSHRSPSAAPATECYSAKCRAWISPTPVEKEDQPPVNTPGVSLGVNAPCDFLGKIESFPRVAAPRVFTGGKIVSVAKRPVLPCPRLSWA